MRKAYSHALHLLFALALSAPQAFAVNSQLGGARTTTYGTPRVKDVNGVGKPNCKVSTMTDKGGKVLAKLCAKDKAECQQEGSCFVKSENGTKLLNVDGRGGWEQVDTKRCKYGTGSMVNGKRACLIPYKTLACDRKVKPGTVVHIPEAVGKHYRIDGGQMQVHDGNFICADTGDPKKISGAGRFDVFTGYKDDAKNEFLNSGFDEVRSGFHYADVTGGKLREDDVLIKNLQDLVQTSGDTPAVGAVADNSGSAGAR
jgi:hypothetical protein